MASVLFKVGDSVYADVKVIDGFSCNVTISGSGYMYPDREYFQCIMSDVSNNYWTYWSDRLKGDIVIPNGVKSIASNMFNCGDLFDNIGTLYIGNDVEYIGDSAFYSLMGKGVKSIVSTSTVLKSLGNACFSNNKKLEQANFNGTVTTLGPHCFKDCENVVSLNLSDQLDMLYPLTFDNCYKLKKFNNGNRIRLIDNSADAHANGIFRNCRCIEYFTIDNSCTFDENSGYAWTGYFYVDLNTGSNCNSDGLQITTIYTNNPEAIAYDWIVHDNRYAIFVKGTEFIYCAHKGKWIKIRGYNREYGDIPVSHEQIYLWIKMLEQGDPDGTPIFLAHNGKWYQIGY